MKWVLIAIAVLAALVAVIALVGLSLPQGHVATVARHQDAEPAVVWTLITDREHFPAWRSGVRSVELLPAEEGNARWREKTKHDAVTMEITEAIPNRRLVSRIADEGLPFGGTWTFELAPDGNGTELRITERGEVYNPIFRFVSRFVMGHTSTMEKYQADAARALTKK